MKTSGAGSAIVEGVALLGGHAAVPEGAGHVDLLADLLHRLLDERQRVLRDGLLLLGGKVFAWAPCVVALLLAVPARELGMSINHRT